MITGLILKNYNPLAKKGVTFVQLDTNDIFNVVVGRNGFGKTSILSQLLPSAPDNADFGEDGMKEWKYEDQRGSFVLRSKTGKRNMHEFILNGKNLNEGHTITVQRDLIRIYFNATPNITNILSGLNVRDLFTTLSTARRKDFMMTINPSDTSFGMKVYDKLKSNYNSIRGGLRIQRQNLAVEESRLNQLASMDTEGLQQEIAVMDNQLKNALILHGALANCEYESIRPLKEEIDKIISKLLGNDHRITMSRHQYVELQRNILNRLDYNRELVTKLTAVLSEVTIQLQGLENTEGNLEGYQVRLQQVRDSIVLFQEEAEQAAQFFRDYPIFNEGSAELDDLLNFHGHEIIDQLQQVVKAADENVSSSIFIEYRQKLAHLKNEHGNVEESLVQVSHKLRHYENAESVTCPECESNFKLGFEKFDPNVLKHEREDLVKRREMLKERIDKLAGWIDANEDWFMSMDALMRFVKRIGGPQVLVDIIKEYRVGKSDSGTLVEVIRRTLRYKQLETQVQQLQSEETTLVAQIKFLQNSDIDNLFKRAQEVERELAIAQRAIIRHQTHYTETTNLIEIIDGDCQLRDRLEMLTNELHAQLEENGKYKIKQRVESIISELSPRKDQLISSLIRANSLQSVITSIRDNIADLEKRERHTYMLMEGLSPVKGLIGQYMNDFLRAVIANMNAVIKNIWSSRLIVMNCETEGDGDTVELSYKFPVISGDTDDVTKDISECSAGEREVINFAFRYVARKYYKGDSAVALFMDEIGAAFDELNRKNFCVWVEEQYRLDALPQTFMISHYIEQFGHFQDVNVIALNTDGISIGVPVNKKAIIR